MIDISKIIYDKINTDNRIINYTPSVTIDWLQAPVGSSAPNIILNDISGSSNEIWRRIQMFQISIWESTKLKSEELRNIIIDIFNRYKWPWIKYINLENYTSSYESSLKEYWYHITFKIKVLDSEF